FDERKAPPDKPSHPGPLRIADLHHGPLLILSRVPERSRRVRADRRSDRSLCSPQPGVSTQRHHAAM
ncbi:MAG: hypothetical protein ACK55O_12510, partial [Phycisphaerales bacterium]